VPIVLAFLVTLLLHAVASGLLISRGHLCASEIVLISAAGTLVVTCSFTRLVIAQCWQKRTFERLGHSDMASTSRRQQVREKVNEIFT